MMSSPLPSLESTGTPWQSRSKLGEQTHKHWQGRATQHSSFFLSLFDSWIVCHIMLVSLWAPWWSCYPSFLNRSDVSIRPFSNTNEDNRSAKIQNMIFPSTFSKQMGRNWPNVLEFFSFGMCTSSALLHDNGTTFRFQTTFNNFHNDLLSSSHF